MRRSVGVPTGGAGGARCRRSPRAVAVAVAALLGACAPPEEAPPPTAIAELAGEPVTLPAFEAYLVANGAGRGPGLSADVRSRLLDRFLVEEMLRREAVARGLVAPGAGSRSAVDALLADSPPAEPTGGEVEAARGDVPERPERVRLSQILVADRRRAEELRARLERGEEFAALANEHSVDPSAERGGDQGLLSRGDLPPALADVVFALEPGEVSEVVPAEYGFHLFLVRERVGPGPPPPAEAESIARREIARRRLDGRLGELVVKLAGRYNPKVYAWNLPFEYTGRHPVAESPGGR